MKHARSDYQGRIVDLAGRIPADEPVFLLRGQDQFAAPAVRFWADLVRPHNPDLSKIALVHANALAHWPVKKSPDEPHPLAAEVEDGNAAISRHRDTLAGFDEIRTALRMPKEAAPDAITEAAIDAIVKASGTEVVTVEGVAMPGPAERIAPLDDPNVGPVLDAGAVDRLRTWLAAIDAEVVKLGGKRVTKAEAAVREMIADALAGKEPPPAAPAT